MQAVWRRAQKIHGHNGGAMQVIGPLAVRRAVWVQPVAGGRRPKTTGDA